MQKQMPANAQLFFVNIDLILRHEAVRLVTLSNVVSNQSQFLAFSVCHLLDLPTASSFPQHPVLCRPPGLPTVSLSLQWPYSSACSSAYLFFQKRLKYCFLLAPSVRNSPIPLGVLIALLFMPHSDLNCVVNNKILFCSLDYKGLR